LITCSRRQDSFRFLRPGAVAAYRVPAAGRFVADPGVSILPPGSTFRDTLAVAEQAREIVQQHPHVKMVYTAVGRRRGGLGSIHAARGGRGAQGDLDDQT